MQINQCTITEAELVTAVQAFLTTQGISLPVAKVTKTYRNGGGYDVEFKEPECEPEPSRNEMAEKEIPA